jgi:DNA-binding NtrC family response regulator
LRDRASDIPILARHLVVDLAERHRRASPRLTPAAAELLQQQKWPGNVRQLSNVLERALILDDNGVVDASDLEHVLRPATEAEEEERVRAALKEANGDKHDAARLLGISYRTLQRRVKQFDLEGYPKYR